METHAFAPCAMPHVRRVAYLFSAHLLRYETNCSASFTNHTRHTHRTFRTLHVLFTQIDNYQAITIVEHASHNFFSHKSIKISYFLGRVLSVYQSPRLQCGLLSRISLRERARVCSTTAEKPHTKKNQKKYHKSGLAT